VGHTVRVKHLNLFAILVTFLLIILGGIVYNTQSSLACPDWPTCYGSFFPKMEGGILIEHGHRLLATLVGFLTTLLVIFTYRKYKTDENYQSSFHLACVALIMVMAQGILGGITVIYKLPTIVSTTHLGLSMVFFCTLILLHHQLSQSDSLDRKDEINQEELTKVWKPSLRHGILGMGFFIYTQMILGAFMRHSGAGVSCGLGPDAWGLCLETSTWTKTWWPSLHPAQLHMVHRYFAIFVGLGTLHYCLKQLLEAIRHKAVLKNISGPIIFWSALVVLSIITQIGLGVMTVSMNLAIVPTTAHLGVAAICLAAIFKLNLVLKSVEEKYFTTTAHSFMSDIFELTKPKLSALVVSTSLVGILLAPGQINFFQGLLSLLLIGMVVVGGCALNCYIEIDVDGLMERTKVRSLPSGRLNANWALGFGVIMLLIAIPLLVFRVNPLTAVLSTLAAVLYLFFYTPMKIKSPYAVVVGAIPGAIPPMLGWTAVTGKLDFDVWALFLILFFWQIPHFLAISIFNADDYKTAKIKVFPNISGFQKTRNSIIFLTFIMLLIGVLPHLIGSASQLFLFASLGLSTIMIIVALFGLKHSSQNAALVLWSKRYFWGTIIYLPLLLGAMIFLK
jgi:heme o synthase